MPTGWKSGRPRPFWHANEHSTHWMQDRLPGACTPAATGTAQTMTIRSSLIGAALGILTAVLAVCLFTARARQDPAARPGANEAVAEAAIPFGAGPICSSTESLDPDFAAGKRAMVGGNWNAAIKALTSAGLRDARNADIQNYLGYAYRRLHDLDQAIRHHRQAVTLNPRHRGAHEHLGEAYLVQGDLAKAEEHLGALERICLIPCQEYDDLKRAIREHDRVANEVFRDPRI